MLWGRSRVREAYGHCAGSVRCKVKATSVKTEVIFEYDVHSQGE